MGLRFRKSVKIAPGVRVNLNKKSTSVSFGTKGLRTTYSTTGRKTTTVGIPGTGLSYSSTANAKDTSGVQSRSETHQPSEAASSEFGTVCIMISIVVVLFSLVLSLASPLALVATVLGIALFAIGYSSNENAKDALRQEERRKEEQRKEEQREEEEARRISRNAELLAWQNAICEDKTDNLFMSVDQLEDATVQVVSDDIRIFDDCSKILNKTTNPTVFFPRLALAEEKLMHLCSLEVYIDKTYQITMIKKPSELYNIFLENKDRYVCDFIYKYCQTVKDKADTLKTERGKQNQFQKFYDSLQPYYDQISEKNKGYIEAMYQRKI